ncbi:MAG: hypothetical protein OEY77_02885 [Nitrospira sp.]|nr:hypothetical protein [Nitrospira sp.]
MKIFDIVYVLIKQATASGQEPILSSTSKTNACGERLAILLTPCQESMFNQ